MQTTKLQPTHFCIIDEYILTDLIEKQGWLQSEQHKKIVQQRNYVYLYMYEITNKIYVPYIYSDTDWSFKFSIKLNIIDLDHVNLRL